MDKKEAPLNLNELNNQGNISSKKKGLFNLKDKKSLNKVKTYIILAVIIFAALFLFFGYYIFRNLTTLNDLKKVLKKSKKELEDGDKTRIELIEKIDSVEKQIELKKRYVKEKKELDEQKLAEYNGHRKKYEELEALQNRIIEEKENSLVYDEAISNLNLRIKNTEH